MGQIRPPGRRLPTPDGNDGERKGHKRNSLSKGVETWGAWRLGQSQHCGFPSPWGTERGTCVYTETCAVTQAQHGILNSFSLQVFTECLFRARHCTRHWRRRKEQGHLCVLPSTRPSNTKAQPGIQVFVN